MEKQFDCIKLHFTAPLHLSRGREQYDESAKVLHSDALAASLFVAALRLGASEQEALSMVGSFRLTSAFPFWQEEYFFPKPLARLPFPIKNTPEEKRGKPYKKIRFLGKTWFEKMLRGEEEEIDEILHLRKKEFLSSILNVAVFKTDVIQRVAIAPDYFEDARPFFTERIFFNDNAGLFFLIEWEDETVKDLFRQSLRLLGDLGIGTDRSVGNGFYPGMFNPFLAVARPCSTPMHIGIVFA
ncbi:MAG: type III-A CRISPR-associated RAMP protein Csm4 [Haliscomenobacter sp.]|nr:type III-A CRISPR-associated RAMP protein Csm4 [Haliscomenobacter sp.]